MPDEDDDCDNIDQRLSGQCDRAVLNHTCAHKSGLLVWGGIIIRVFITPSSELVGFLPSLACLRFLDLENYFLAFSRSGWRWWCCGEIRIYLIVRNFVCATTHNSREKNYRKKNSVLNGTTWQRSPRAGSQLILVIWSMNDAFMAWFVYCFQILLLLRCQSWVHLLFWIHRNFRSETKEWKRLRHSIGQWAKYSHTCPSVEKADGHSLIRHRFIHPVTFLYSKSAQDSNANGILCGVSSTHG